MKKILIIGATSAIAEATARLWAAEGHALYLLGRNEERLATIAADLTIRGVKTVRYAALDLNDSARHVAVLDTATAVLQGLDIALIAHGTLGDQTASERDFEVTLQQLNTNAISVISLLTHLANRFEVQKHGSIAVIGSVAGDRGRQSNYVYGTAKGAIAIFMQGLRNRLDKSGIQVLTIKPGFVDTPMTMAITKKGPLWATPETIAKSIVAGIEKKRNVIYAPWYWVGIMAMIRIVPENLFKRLSL